jgi:hypothetical protein
MKKPAMIIDVLAGGHGPGDEDDEDDEMDESTPSKDPAALIASIEQQLSELRSYVREMG